MSFVLNKSWRSAPIKQQELRKDFVFPSTLYSSFPHKPFCNAVNTLFFLQNEHLHILIGQERLFRLPGDNYAVSIAPSPQHSPLGHQVRDAATKWDLWPGHSLRESEGEARKVLFIFTGDSSTAHKRCQTLNLMVFQAAAAFCAARLGSIPFTALACVLMWSMVQPKPG